MVKKLQQAWKKGLFLEKKNMYIQISIIHTKESIWKKMSVIMLKPAKLIKESFVDMIKRIKHHKDQPDEINNWKESDDRKDPLYHFWMHIPWWKMNTSTQIDILCILCVPENKACKDINNKNYAMKIPNIPTVPEKTKLIKSTSFMMITFI